MRKEAQVDLRGLSPETVMQNSQPPAPMETPGYSKAKAIMDMASQIKTASTKAGPVTLPQIEKLLEKHKEDDRATSDKARLARYVGAGAGAGSLVGRTTNLARSALNFHPPKAGASKLELAAIGVGALAGGLSARKSKKKTASGITPGTQLRDSRAVGRHPISTGESEGKTTPQLIRGRLMGNKIKVSGMSTGSEELDRVKSIVLTREDTRAAADVLFGDQAVAARKKERELVAKLFLQAPAAQTMTPMLQKEASIQELAPNTVAFFEKNAKAMGLTDAQIRYPELLKVAAGRPAGFRQPSPFISKASVATSANGEQISGAIPTQSVGTGA